MSNSDTVAKSYELQKKNFSRTDENSRKIQQTWFEEDTVDYWRHFRMVAPLKPLLNHFRNTKWITVGDGRFGLDTIRLLKIQPELDILSTDLATELLKEAKEKNLIKDYRAENAEFLSFADASFDFAFCKESYHHFPRPYIALYEMLRVAKKGVILIEPNERRDKMIPERILNVIKRCIKRIIGKPILHPETWNFEESGNYIYGVSKAEMEKVGIGLQLPTVAFYFYNDYYETGVEFQKAEPGNAVFKKVKSKIAWEDLKCRWGFQTYKEVIVILFKENPGTELRGSLEASGFRFVDLPVNPFINKGTSVS